MAQTADRGFLEREPGHGISIWTAAPAYQAYQALHFAFTVAPIIAGIDKFSMLLANWDAYLAPVVARMLPFSPHMFMMIVGAIEIAAGVLVAFRPRIFAYVVSAWLVGIIINLLLCGMFFDIALRDLGLAIAAFALGRLAVTYDVPGPATA
jgi:hypothetical protein